MENKSATKGTGYNKMGLKQKGTDPKISPCKKYVVMITAA